MGEKISRGEDGGGFEENLRGPFRDAGCYRRSLDYACQVATYRATVRTRDTGARST